MIVTSFCIKEHESCKSNAQTVFNSVFTEARNPIQCVYERLKARWRILSMKIDLKLESISTINWKCFALHYLCERNKKGVNEDFKEIFKVLKKISMTKHIVEIPQKESMPGIC